VLYKDMIDGTAPQKKEFAKLSHTAQLAREDDLNYIWVDTCCIDKSSSSELQEAINSMFFWYERSEICYAYLSDVEDPISFDEDDRVWESFPNARWFTRGWTLQELLAPLHIVFYSKSWKRIGSRSELQGQLSVITGIRRCFLEEKRKFEDRCSKKLPGTMIRSFNEPPASVAERMSWAAKRQTSRPEDIAYSLLGLFSVHMAMLYGEGEKAFLRLQEEILKQATDYSIFAWRDPNASYQRNFRGLLAENPSWFADAGNIRPEIIQHDELPPVFVTGRGLQIEANILKLDPFGNEAVIFLGCRLVVLWLGIIVRRSGSGSTYSRVCFDQLLGFEENPFHAQSRHWQMIYAPQFVEMGTPWKTRFPIQKELVASHSSVLSDLSPLFLSRPQTGEWDFLGWTTKWKMLWKAPLLEDETGSIVVSDTTWSEEVTLEMQFVPMAVKVPDGSHNLREKSNSDDYYGLTYHVKSEGHALSADEPQYGNWEFGVNTHPVKKDEFVAKSAAGIPLVILFWSSG
jgi:hypothetical protein